MIDHYAYGERRTVSSTRPVMKDTFFGGADIDVDCKVRVITDGKKGDIINRYVRFCHVLNEQIGIHGRTRKAVEENIRICRDENVRRDVHA